MGYVRIKYTMNWLGGFTSTQEVSFYAYNEYNPNALYSVSMESDIRLSLLLYQMRGMK